MNDADNVKMRDKVLDYFGDGRGGLSSKAMALAAIELKHGNHHPSDPADFNRCLMLLDAVPEIRDHMDRVAAISGTWAKMVDRWDEVEKCFLEEVGFNWSKGHSAPLTYKLMMDVIA